MMLAGAALDRGRLACDLAALLGERDIFRGSGTAREADLTSRLEVLRAEDGSGSAGQNIDRAACRRVAQTSRQYQRQMKIRTPSRGDNADLKQAGLLLAFAYPDRIGRRRPGGAGRYLLSGGRGAFLDAGDPLGVHSFLVAAHLDAGQTEARIYLAAAVQVEELTQHFRDLIESREEILWDDRLQGVSARQQRRLGALILQEAPLAGPDPEAVGRALIEGIRKKGLEQLPWTTELRNWQQRVLLMRRIEGGQNWPDVSDAALADRLQGWLLPYLAGMTRLEQLRGLDLKNALLALLPPDRLRRLNRLAPTHLEVPSGSRVRLDYTQAEAPVLAVRLQEMFGQHRTPKIADGRIAVVLHLLSPAMRPVQVTRDLESFWRNIYTEVRKDLRGRYPKHFWPPDPLQAPPVRGVKKRAG